MPPKKKTDTPDSIEILRINEGRMICYIRGVTPLIYNSMSAKTWMDLLYPSKKTKVEKETTAKHNPMLEFRRSMYTQPTGDTVCTIPAVSFKRALASAAIDLPGTGAKAQIDRLVWAIGERIPVFGIPQLRMDIVRVGMAKTPDVRTRACLTEWATVIELAYVKPIINDTTLANLLAGAGTIRGVGDFRQGKGAGNYGQFELVEKGDPDWERIRAEGGREAQLKAIANPVCYDQQSEELLEWWHTEHKRRGRTVDEDVEEEDDETGSNMLNGNGAHSEDDGERAHT